MLRPTSSSSQAISEPEKRKSAATPLLPVSIGQWGDTFHRRKTFRPAQDGKTGEIISMLICIWNKYRTFITDDLIKCFQQKKEWYYPCSSRWINVVTGSGQLSEALSYHSSQFPANHKTYLSELHSLELQSYAQLEYSGNICYQSFLNSRMPISDLPDRSSRRWFKAKLNHF